MATRTSRSALPQRLALVAYDGLRSFEYAIAADLFAPPRPYLGVPWYETVVVSPDRGPLRGVGGLCVKPDAPFEAIHEAHTIVVPGWRTLGDPLPALLHQALQAAAARGARVMALCSGAFALGAAGLLDGKRATTHWLFADTFKARFPQVQFEPDVLYVDEGNVITSAGSAAGLDACLHLVRRDFGAAVANTVARRMVAPPHREGGQAQYVEAPVRQRGGGSPIGRAMDWARAHLHEPIGVPDLAGRAAMSPRNFLRHFQAAVGSPPNTWLQQQRITRARQLLEASALPLADLAAQCGYESPETFRAAFRRCVGVAPASYRARFSRTAGVAA
jgi:AraC family transcriptional regulator, transcriptional activator FtrA